MCFRKPHDSGKSFLVIYYMTRPKQYNRIRIIANEENKKQLMFCSEKNEFSGTTKKNMKGKELSTLLIWNIFRPYK